MLTIGLFPNTKKESVGSVLGWMIQYFKDRNVRVLLTENAAQKMGWHEIALQRHKHVIAWRAQGRAIAE